MQNSDEHIWIWSGFWNQINTYARIYTNWKVAKLWRRHAHRYKKGLCLMMLWFDFIVLHLVWFVYSRWKISDAKQWRNYNRYVQSTKAPYSHLNWAGVIVKIIWAICHRSRQLLLFASLSRVQNKPFVSVTINTGRLMSILALLKPLFYIKCLCDWQDSGVRCNFSELPYWQRYCTLTKTLASLIALFIWQLVC